MLQLIDQPVDESDGQQPDRQPSGQTRSLARGDVTDEAAMANAVEVAADGATAEAGVDMVVRSAADETRPLGLGVNAVQPGLVSTDLSAGRHVARTDDANVTAVPGCLVSVTSAGAG
jgi:NAD(P)-dependent dehydrogenase (short-subunit alcohol dehydrogenase family)